MAEETTTSQTEEETTTAEAAGTTEKETSERGKTAEEYRRELREYERNAKRASAKKDKELEELRNQLAEREDATKSEHEKALEEARKQAREEALSEAEKERRHDRLEVASTRLAAKGFEVGEGDDAQTLRFADPDDALIYVDRAIRAGDVDADDIFNDEGKVQADALQNALADILESKPHLRLTENGRPKGSPDTRRGAAADTDLEAMTPEDHARRKYAQK